MPAIVPTLEQVEDYVHSVEELIFASLSAATPDLPNVRQAIQRLWEDVLRHGPQALPSLPDLHIPGLGAFEVPPPPPPPPPPLPKSLIGTTADWMSTHKCTTALISLSLIGVGLYAGYGTVMYQQHARSRRTVKISGNTERRRIVGTFRQPLTLDVIKTDRIHSCTRRRFTSWSRPRLGAGEARLHCDHQCLRA